MNNSVWRNLEILCACIGEFAVIFLVFSVATNVCCGLCMQRTAACLGSAGEVDKFNKMVLKK